MTVNAVKVCTEEIDPDHSTFLMAGAVASPKKEAAYYVCFFSDNHKWALRWKRLRSTALH